MNTILSFLLKNIKIELIIILALALAYVIYTNANNKAEIKRLENNQSALTSKLDTFKLKDGRNAARIKELEMTAKEFDENIAYRDETIKELNLKLLRIEMYSKTGTKTEIKAITYLHDTIINNDTVYAEKIKYFKWNNEWNSIYGKIYPDNKVECTYSGVDSLTIIASRVPKKFLFFKYGTKYLQVNIVNQNKNSKITYNQTVKIKK